MNELIPIEPDSESSLDDFMLTVSKGLAHQLNRIDLARVEEVTGISTPSVRASEPKTSQSPRTRRKKPRGKSALNDSLRQYLLEISKIELLSAEQEVELARSMEAGVLALEALSSGQILDEQLSQELALVAEMGRQSKKTMVRANLRLVVSLAKRSHSTTSFDLMDAIQEGNIGLLRATEMFDFRQGFKFSTYATWRIRQTISRGLADQGRVIRLPVHAVDDLAKIRKAQKLLEASGREITVGTLAAYAELSVKKTLKLLEANREVLSLDARLDSLPETFLEDVGVVATAWPGRFTLTDVLVEEEDLDVGDSASKNQLIRQMESLFDSLSEREAGVMRMRWGLVDGIPRTLDQIGDTYGVTRERIRQIESKTMAKLRHPTRMEGLRDYLS